jgi:hypothetical protein
MKKEFAGSIDGDEPMCCSLKIKNKLPGKHPGKVEKEDFVHDLAETCKLIAVLSIMPLVIAVVLGNKTMSYLSVAIFVISTVAGITIDVIIKRLGERELADIEYPLSLRLELKYADGGTRLTDILGLGLPEELYGYDAIILPARLYFWLLDQDERRNGEVMVKIDSCDGKPYVSNYKFSWVETEENPLVAFWR